MKFNQELITKARKGEIAILNDGSVEELNELLLEIEPKTVKHNGFFKHYLRCQAFYWDTYDDPVYFKRPIHSVKEFYMIDAKDNEIIDAEPENGKEYIHQTRTYKVTRGQMHELYSEAMATGGHVKIMEITSLRFGVWENETNLFNDDLEEISSILPQSPLLKSIFPEYFHIPEGEPVLVRQEDGQDWNILISNGRGGAYTNGRLYGFSDTFKQIIPFTKNPPK